MPPVTRTEGSLARLARESFLSLWTHPNVFRNTGLASKGRDGQELCDLLAILGDDVIVFSDKECAIGPGDIATTGPRWHRRAALNSLKQVGGAVRWLRVLRVPLRRDLRNDLHRGTLTHRRKRR